MALQNQRGGKTFFDLTSFLLLVAKKKGQTLGLFSLFPG